ncbi:hypothetical protein GWI33_017411 [Rhynchophorus ferrugineus]|uniref:Uncharacterized protein n=1 Tax=Rhynchophorus ferrugineus TaxID=354439 RepID=A0A834ITT2_RHYFE|nr:hypothetical protein GWI33_017411 [Rhynchophorus ferrugineus]
MITAWLTIFTLALTVKLSRETNDLLNLFRPKSNLPPELNDFLLEVQNHKKDFAFIRNVVTQRKRNEKKFSENNILVEDNNENLNDLQNEINLLHNINKEEGGNLNNKNTPAATTKKSFKYSKYLHSPIRLRRELDLNVDHKSSAGVINRPGIRNSLNDKNKYQAESTYERNDDKSQQKISDIKKKREIEISIKSDGRVIKKIDENENGPKSVILNIKTGTDGTDCASTRSFSSNGGLGRVQTMINIIQQPNTTPLSPNDFSYIPSIDSNADQNKNPAAPINPISSNAMLNPQPYAANNLDTYQSQNDKTSGASRAVNNVSKKMENNKGKSNNHMEKTIDTALNNQYDLDEHPKEGEPGIRKKMKSEDDYSDEEDAVFDKSTKRRKINRTIDQDNDDEYNYSEISNGTLPWPLIENVNEQAANLKEQSKASAITGVHGGKNTHLKKRPYKKKPKDQYIKRENRNAVHKIKLAKTLNRNKDNKSKHSKYADEKAQKHKKLKHKYIDRPLSSQQKQDIFLRYNPEFQRFPRFLQDENRYRNVMEKRAMENPRYFHNTYDRFPISNDYFIKPKRGEFVKREEEETTTQGKKQTETEEAVSESSASNLAEEAATIPESESNPDQGSTMGNRQKFEQPNGNAADTATLPPAAKDILETAESDLFENTTLPGLLAVDNNNPQIQNKTNNMITPLIFTTNADDLTEGTECSAEPGARQEKFTPCPDENLNHSSVTMTSILPIISEDVTLLRTNISKEDYIDLNEIIGGSLPKDIVSQSLSNAKGSIRKGLNVKRYNTNIQLSGYNNSLETKMILDEMSNLMMKLKYHTSCQQLTPDLKLYLKIITRNEMDSVLDKVKDMEDVDLDEHQSSYLFHSGETESLPSKATVMKQLLAKFNALPDNCKERAEPVKEYIESHLAMIDNASGRNASSQAPAPKEHTKTKKEINELDRGNEDNLENQVIVEGLSNSNANANEVIEDIKKDKRETNEVSYDQDISTSTSQQYGRLAEAVRKMRNRRENEKRINQIYGKAKRSPKNDQELAGNHGFESPLLINY